MTIRCDDLEKKGLQAVLESMEKATSKMAEQQTEHFFARLGEICKESGQIYDAQGRSLTFDTLLDFLETLEIDFDRQGQPLMPTIVAGRSVIEKIKDLKTSNEQNERLNEIIERKRSEWRSRESDRRLAN
jgi:hypothetical protein